MKDHYPCLICMKDYNSLRSWRRHIYLRHCILEIEQKLRRTLEETMGKKDLKEARVMVMNSIRKGKFLEFVVKLLSQDADFTLEGIDRTFLIDFDQNAVSQQKRKSLYTQGRDLLMKLAEDIGDGQVLADNAMSAEEVRDEMKTYSWDLSHDYGYENFPVVVAECLQYALMAERDYSEFLPRFSRFYRSG